ncbi:hypothetical protein GCM10009853_066900 [Glycomyces scopariae]
MPSPIQMDLPEGVVTGEPSVVRSAAGKPAAGAAMRYSPPPPLHAAYPGPAAAAAEGASTAAATAAAMVPIRIHCELCFRMARSLQIAVPERPRDTRGSAGPGRPGAGQPILMSARPLPW